MKMKTAALAAMALLFSSQQGEAQERRGAPQNETQILFICEHGYAKSLMAACCFNRRAEAQHLPFRAVARGVAPDSDTIPPLIAAGLLREGFDLSGFHPLKVGEADLKRSQKVIVIGTQLGKGSWSGSLEAWNGVPAASENFDASIQEIERRVSELLARLTPAEK